MKKIIGSFLAALISLATVVTPALATVLGDFPTFLGKDGVMQAYVVIGSAAGVEDVIGGVDIAVRLAELSYTTTSVTGGGSTVNGLEKNAIDIKWGNLTDLFPSLVRTFHYSGLKQGQITWIGDGNNYDYHEDINLNAGSSKVFFSHDFGTAGINGTETMVLPAGAIAYEYVFDKALQLNSKTGNGNISATAEYNYPVNVVLLGQPFTIVAVGSGQVKMLTGSTGLATATQGVTYGDYTVYAVLGGTNFVRVAVKDTAGNTVEEALITSVPNSVTTTKTTPLLTIKALSVAALTDGTVVGANLVVGAQGSLEKTYSSSCDVTGTGSADVKFPGTTNWCIQTSGFTGPSSQQGWIQSGDKIQVIYKPTTQPEYYKAGSKISLPGDNGDIGFEGWNYDTFATLTFTPKTGLSGYCLTGAGTTNSTVCASGLSGIEIASDVGGTIVFGGTGYSKAYILFGNAFAASGDNRFPVYMGLWDSVNSRVGIENDTLATYATSKFLNSTVGYANTNVTMTFTISYAGGAAVTDQQTLSAVVSWADPGTSLFKSFTLGPSGLTNAISLPLYNKSATWSTSATPEFRLYTSDSAEAKDVTVKSTDTSGVQQTADVGLANQDVVTDGGSIVLSPYANSASQVIKVKIPAQTLYVKAYVGKLGAGGPGGTCKTVVPITTQIAKMDTELLTNYNTVDKHLVVMGDAAVNQIAAKAMGLPYPTYGSSGLFPYAADQGYLKVYDNPFNNTAFPGQVVLLVAGWEGKDTRLAADALQAGKLAGQNVNAVKITGSITSPVITPA